MYNQQLHIVYMFSNKVLIILLRPSLQCNTSLHFTTLHSSTLIDTSLPLIYSSLPSHLA